MKIDTEGDTLRLETGMIKVEAKVWMTVLNHRLKLTLCPRGLAPLTQQDNFQSSWKQAVYNKVAQLSFSPSLLLAMGWDKAKTAIKQRILDTERQADLSKVTGFLAPDTCRFIVSCSAYLAQLEIPSHRRAFTLARCHALSSAILEGKYKKIPFMERLCPCDSGEVETIDHVLLSCPFYKDSRDRLISPLLLKYPGHSSQVYAKMLLSDDNRSFTYNVARFCGEACKIRRVLIAS
ncbi:uncharacterized protein LOC128332077 isoform X2 [Hemicordylus capensis]|uniref:uncharacterized protein LOC128332077 isoform X2 n=1 Tax=Hemicordylus capensis TaxID=884348 RepID=UPI00230351E1|nr:uncharacterized protein LOC128332077 isoform X2 [Hemicordylus capensis]